MTESEVAFWLRALSAAQEEGVIQRFSDGSVITIRDLVHSRFLSLGLRLVFDEQKKLYYVVAF